jgi:CheY-like chemotaxis protein
MLRILAVDDWPDSTTSLQSILQEWGYEARVATDGATALTIANSFHPDVVILDLAMPGMHGYEVVKRLRQLDLQKASHHYPFGLLHSRRCTPLAGSRL